MSENKDYIDLRDYFGKGVRLNEEKKSINKREEEFFLGLIDSLFFIDERAIQLIGLGLDITKFEDPYLLLIESLIFKYYGETESGVIFWWIQQKQDNPGKKIKAQFGDGKEYIINTPKQLYKVLKKIGKLLEDGDM